jgi:hypothetical protein
MSRVDGEDVCRGSAMWETLRLNCALLDTTDGDRELCEPLPRRRVDLSGALRVDPTAEPAAIVVCGGLAQKRALELCERVLGSERCVCVRPNEVTTIPGRGVLLLAHANGDALGGNPCEFGEKSVSLIEWAHFVFNASSGIVVLMEHCSDASTVSEACGASMTSVAMAVGRANVLLRKSNAAALARESELQRKKNEQCLRSYRALPKLQCVAPEYFAAGSTERFVFNICNRGYLTLEDVSIMHIACDMLIRGKHRVCVQGADEAPIPRGPRDVVISCRPGDATADVAISFSTDRQAPQGRIATMSNNVDTRVYVATTEPPTLQWPVFSAPSICRIAAARSGGDATARSSAPVVLLCGHYSDSTTATIFVESSSIGATVRTMKYASCGDVRAIDLISEIARCDVFILLAEEADAVRATRGELRQELVVAGILDRPCITNVCPPGIGGEFVWESRGAKDAIAIAKDMLVSRSARSGGTDLWDHASRRSSRFSAFCASTLSSSRIASRILDMAAYLRPRLDRRS